MTHGTLPKGYKPKVCNDPDCRLTREGFSHSHASENDRRKHKINRIKAAIFSLLTDL